MPYPIEATDERMRAITPASSASNSTRPSWPYAVSLAVLVAVYVVLALNLPGTGEAPIPRPLTPTATASGPVTLPEVAGRNAGDVTDQLRAAGLPNVLVTRGNGEGFVAEPGDWTASTITPGPGTVVRPDAVVVLTVSGGDDG